MDPSHDLNRLVARWREEMEARPAIDSHSLDELESHLWDEIERRLAGGASPRESLLQASARLGHPDVLAGEYRKVTEWSSFKRPRWQTPFWYLVMWKSYLSIALRNLRKQPGYSAINIGGLALGLACAFLIVLFVRHERSFDDFHEKGDRLYRFIRHTVAGESSGDKSVIFPAGVVSQIEDRYPEIEAAILYDFRTPFLKHEGRNVRPGTVAFMGNEALEAFSFPLLRGNPATALDDPYSIVLTEHVAQIMFGAEDPMGTQLSYNDAFDLTVSGILADVPANSHLQFDALVPITLMTELMGEGAMEDFSNVNYMLYALLTPGSDPVVLEEKLQDYLLEWYNGNVEAASQVRLELQPIGDIHLEPGFGWERAVTIDPMYLLMFLGVAFLILFIAGANFTNLATARALQRAREVGVRKTAGALKGQIVTQFLMESLLLGLLAVVLALVLMHFAMPTFRDLVGTQVSFDFSDWGALLLLLGLGVFFGFTAGLYPAFFLSAFRPVQVLKGEMTGGKRGAALRKGLIVVQFGISIFLVVATLSVHNQLRYMQSLSLGFETEQVVWAPLSPPIRESFDAFADEALTHARIASVSQAGNVPGRVNTSRGYNWPGQEAGEENGQSFYTVLADHGYLETLGLTLLAGRDFSRDIPTDFENAYILNETAAREIGFADPVDAVGAPFRAWDKEMGQIIGVVKDFNFQSLHQPVDGVVINIKPWISYALFRVTPGDAGQAIEALQQTWSRFDPEYPFEYRFLDEDIERLYSTEQRLGKLFTAFAGLAIFVACLGLFGLAAYSAQRRTREIGIRKALGADTGNIVLLLSREFTLLVAAAFCLAAPLGWYVMTQWIDEFAYQASISWLIFVAAGLGSLLIAWLTVSFQAFKAASSDPVKSLRFD